MSLHISRFDSTVRGMTTSTVLELPRTRVADPIDAPTLCWGILGPGWIAQRFVESLQTDTAQEVEAVASRGLARAQAFADQWGIRCAHGSYGALLASEEVDVVYVATPHTAHFDCAMAALDHGKHVVIEKPLALNGAQGRAIRERATALGLFCMEAMWTSFLPKFDVIDQIIEAGFWEPYVRFWQITVNGSRPITVFTIRRSRAGRFSTSGPIRSVLRIAY